MTVTHLVIGPEIIDAIGVEKAAVFQDQITGYDCVECGIPGDARQDKAVAVLRTDHGLAHLGVAHHHCATSHIRTYPSGALDIAATTDLIPRAVAAPSSTGMRPLLLLAYEEDIHLTAAPHIDPVVEWLLGQGLHRLSGLGRQAPDSPGWHVGFGPGTALDVHTPHQPLLRDGQMTAPAAWSDLVWHEGAVTVLVGRLDRAVIYADTPPFTAYHQAVRRGRLVGGHLTVSTRSTD
ncbi:hypothetical protein ACIO3O_37805 [Streptomyces sp. NPDC087440]|uniref:hypothetical protein n=1 Tax=Streptomyces sp. NPDC087440 TaxID=3365790 RepID=UPI00381F7BB7